MGQTAKGNIIISSPVVTLPFVSGFNIFLSFLYFKDGPALRATVLMAFAREYIKRNGIQGLEFVESVLYAGHLPAHTIIKADMEYVANNWYLPGFDIWEEVCICLYSFRNCYLQVHSFECIRFMVTMSLLFLLACVHYAKVKLQETHQSIIIIPRYSLHLNLLFYQGAILR